MESDKQSENGIDLVALASVLWQGKLWVAVIAISFAVMAAVYALKAQEWWTAKALVEAPQVFDYEAYYVSIQEFKQILNDQSRDRHLEKSLDRYVAPEALLHEFKTTYNSSTVKKSFLLEDEVFQGYLSEHKLVGAARMNAVKAWSKNISASLVDKKSKDSLLILKFQSVAANASATQLENYLEFVLVQSRQKMLRSIESMKKTQRLKLVNEYEMLDRLTRENLQLQIARFEHSYNIAAAAGANKPLLDQSGSGDYFPISLGSEAIAARIKALKSIKDLSVVESDLLRIKAELDRVDAFSLSEYDQFSMFSYVDAIDEPLTRDKPKRALIVAVAFLLGLLFGSIFVGARSYLAVVREDAL